MFVGIGETNSPGWTCTVATWVTDTPFMLSFLANFQKRASYWIHGNNPPPDHMKYKTQF